MLICLIEMFDYFSFRAKTQKLMNFERCLLFPPVYCLLYFDYPLFLKTSNTKCILKLLNVSSIPVCEHSPVNKCIYTLCRLIFVAWNFFQEKTIWMIKNVYSSSFLFFCFLVFFLISHVKYTIIWGWLLRWKICAFVLNILFYQKFWEFFLTSDFLRDIYNYPMPQLCVHLFFFLMQRRKSALNHKSWFLDSLKWGVEGKGISWKLMSVYKSVMNIPRETCLLVLLSHFCSKTLLLRKCLN